MMQAKYSKSLAVGTVCGAGTLGILIPPSIMLIIMADRLQLSVGDLFLAAVVPGLILTGLYAVFHLRLRPDKTASCPGNGTRR